MLGYLYHDAGNTSPLGQPFEGLTGKESCPGSNGTGVPVRQITPSTPNAYLLPGADPGEAYTATDAAVCPSTPAVPAPLSPRT